jgi:hypothetical protein
VILKLIFPLTNQGGGDAVLLGELQDAHLAIERLGGVTDFKLGGKVFFCFISLIRSGCIPHTDQLKFQQNTGSVLRDHFMNIGDFSG